MDKPGSLPSELLSHHQAVLVAPEKARSATPAAEVSRGIPSDSGSIPAQSRPASSASRPVLAIGAASLDSASGSRNPNTGGSAETASTTSAATARPRMAPGSKPSTPLTQPNGVLAPRAPNGAKSTRAASPITARLTTAAITKPAPAASSSGTPQSTKGSATDLASR